MASKITAIRRYKPDIQREPTLLMPQILTEMTKSTGLNEGSILHVLYILCDTILDAHRHGRAVKIERLGIFSPVLRMDGSLDILFRPDVQMLKKLNIPAKFHAKILNKANIGKSSKDLIEQWNKDYPEDPVDD